MNSTELEKKDQEIKRKITPGKILLFIITYLLFIAFFAGGVYIIIEEEDIIYIGGILAGISFPFLIFMLKIVMRLDTHGFLDAFSFTISSLIVIIIIALIIFVGEFASLFLYNIAFQVLIIISCSVLLLVSYKLADKESFRFGSFLIIISNIFLYYALTGFILNVF